MYNREGEELTGPNINKYRIYTVHTHSNDYNLM